MKKSAVIIFLGSEKDRQMAERIITFWKKNNFDICFEVRALSAHKAAEKVLDAVKEYEKRFESLVFIAIAGRSNALGPLIAGHSRFPVINCPVLQENFGFIDLFSSMRMPSNVPCSTVLDPENAALHAAKILSLTDKKLFNLIEKYMEKTVKEILESDSLIKKEFGKNECFNN
ncbi:MAG: AIR carboxylase family protein [Candidatus Diapherotrites archaeon]